MRLVQASHSKAVTQVTASHSGFILTGAIIPHLTPGVIEHTRTCQRRYMTIVRPAFVIRPIDSHYCLNKHEGTEFITFLVPWAHSVINFAKWRLAHPAPSDMVKTYARLWVGCLDYRQSPTIFGTRMPARGRSCVVIKSPTYSTRNMAVSYIFGYEIVVAPLIYLLVTSCYARSYFFVVHLILYSSICTVLAPLSGPITPFYKTRIYNTWICCNTRGSLCCVPQYQINACSSR